MALPLSEIREPGLFCIQSVSDDGEMSLRLKRLGLCENRRVEVLVAGDPMVVRVVGSRVGLSRELARLVAVDSAE
jgi:Fe2+ transport system protein FeoA